MKQFALWALIAALLTGCFCAQAAGWDTVVPLYDETENGSVLIGTAISAGDGLYVSGGLNGIEFVQPYVVAGNMKCYASHLQLFTNGMALFTTSSQQEAAALSAGDAKNALFAASYGTKGLSVTGCGTLYPLRWQNTDCYLLESAAPLSMGAAVFDATQALTGVVVAAWGEGVDRYVLLPVAGFTDFASMLESVTPSASPAPDSASGAHWLSDPAVSVSGHVMTVTWTPEMLTGAQEDSVVTLFLADEGNSYYSWVYAKASEGSVQAAVVPGRRYQYAVQHTHGQPVAGTGWLQVSKSIVIDEARPYADRQYQDVSIYLGTLPKTAEGFSASVAEKPEAVTRQLLEDESLSLFLQVTSTYAAETEASCEMLITLTAPNGSVFLEPAGYSFLPELAGGDVWNSNLDGLLAEYLKIYGRYEAGEYVIRYYFDGALVNAVSFTIE